jgi:hypothetical protein
MGSEQRRQQRQDHRDRQCQQGCLHRVRLAPFGGDSMILRRTDTIGRSIGLATATAFPRDLI